MVLPEPESPQMSDLAQIIVTALVTGLPGISALVIQLRRQKQEKAKLQAEADQAAGSAVQASGSAATAFAEAAGLVAQQNTELLEKLDRIGAKVDEQDGRIKTLESTVERYARRIAYLMGGIDKLMQQISGLNANPCWSPEDWTEKDGN